MFALPWEVTDAAGEVTEDPVRAILGLCEPDISDPDPVEVGVARDIFMLLLEFRLC
jgi:hypothetical protein